MLPLSRMTAQRTREIELRRNLRTIRTAIDDFKKSYEKKPSAPPASGAAATDKSIK